MKQIILQTVSYKFLVTGRNHGTYTVIYGPEGEVEILRFNFISENEESLFKKSGFIIYDASSARNFLETYFSAYKEKKQ